MLAVEGLESGYGAMQVLWGPSLQVRRGGLTALLGPNGVGKTTLLRTISGLIPSWQGRVMYQGRDITHLPAHRKVEMGLVLVPEGRHLFAGMTVRENLSMGAYLRKAALQMRESLDLVHSLFPLLRDRMDQRAGSLSGGEQQMLVIARALMTRPALMMLDEPSQGLAPKVVGEVFAAIQRLRAEVGVTILLVEQDIRAALRAADHAYVLHEGRIKAHGAPGDLEQSQEVREAYLGM
jgi:branched-chain amino acid transport system ATP-binding protein